MGAWIEIKSDRKVNCIVSSSHPTMGAWIEIATYPSTNSFTTSHPTMGAWIEMGLEII